MNPVLPESYRKEHVFIREIFYEPEDYSARMIYADWLEEHQDIRAELLRMDLELQQSDVTDERRQAIQRRRQKLLTKVDSVWTSLLAMSAIEKCPAAKQAQLEAFKANQDIEDDEGNSESEELEFRFRCPKRWENLTPTDENQQVRFCNECQRSVHYCYDIQTARTHAERGDCVALDPSVPRKAYDLDFTIDMNWFGNTATLGMLDE